MRTRKKQQPLSRGKEEERREVAKGEKREGREREKGGGLTEARNQEATPTDSRKEEQAVPKIAGSEGRFAESIFLSTQSLLGGKRRHNGLLEQREPTKCWCQKDC